MTHFNYSVDVIAVACGPSHVVVVGSEGEIFSWGNGASGRLGLGTEENQYAVFIYYLDV